MNHTQPHISVIQTTELLHYDPAYGDKGYEFCRLRNIDCLPSLDDPAGYFYRRNDNAQSFDREKLTAERRISGQTPLFKNELVACFRKQPILFVVDNDELSGVVHFSDYNKPIVTNYLFSLLSAYERNLRRLAALSGLSPKEMGDYFTEKLDARIAAQEDSDYYQRKVDSFEKKKKTHAKSPPFQFFYLEDLIGLLQRWNIIPLQGKVTDLRNSVVHAHEFVDMNDVTAPDFIYNFATFKTFFQRSRALLDDAQRVENRIRFMTIDAI
jgi:hypothetical protein